MFIPEAWLGKVATIRYRGGTNPDRLRRVYFFETSCGDWSRSTCQYRCFIKGWDFDKENFRNFFCDKIYDQRVVEDSHVLSLPNLLVNSNRELLESKGYDCFEDSDRGRLVACKPLSANYNLTVFGNQRGVVVDIANKKGPAITIEFNDNGGLRVNGHDSDIPGLVSCLSLFMLDCDEVDVILGIDSVLMKAKEAKNNRDKAFSDYA